MPHFKDPSGGLHFIDDAAFVDSLPSGSVEITDAEAAKLQAPDLAMVARANRVPLLAAADIAVNKAEDVGADATAWRKYRQALRDVTKQKGFPEAFTWPEVPQ